MFFERRWTDSREEIACAVYLPWSLLFHQKPFFINRFISGKLSLLPFFTMARKVDGLTKKLVRSTKVICLYNLWKLCWTSESIMNENDLRRVDCYNMPQSNNELKVVPTVFCPITFLAKSNQHRSLRLPNIAWKVESGMHYNACNDFADLGKNRKRSFAQPILVI